MRGAVGGASRQRGEGVLFVGRRRAEGLLGRRHAEDIRGAMAFLERGCVDSGAACLELGVGIPCPYLAIAVL